MTRHLDAMRDPVQNHLFRLASRFRYAIVRSNPSTRRLASLHDFPRGACGDASLLLAKYLQANSCGIPHYVLGRRAGEGHAWLELHEYVIDITADQFADQDAGVIVSKESNWHKSFDGRIHNAADFCLYDRSTVFALTRAYDAITKTLHI